MWWVKHYKLARWSWGMPPRDFETSEIAMNVYFSICFCTFKVFKGDIKVFALSKLYEKGHFA